MKRYVIYFLIVLTIIVLDQTLKLWVHFTYETWPLNIYGEHELNLIGDWFRLHYLLNQGMAFGIEWKNEYGKLLLTAFRLIATAGIAYYLVKIIYKKSHPGLIVCICMILSGAVGNLLDSVFYGYFLNNAPPESPTPWFHGQVIDMLFFPLFQFSLPEWFPWIGGKEYLFFSFIFNIADSSIFLGVLGIFLLQKHFFIIHPTLASPPPDGHSESPVSDADRPPAPLSEEESQHF